MGLRKSQPVQRNREIYQPTPIALDRETSERFNVPSATAYEEDGTIIEISPKPKPGFDWSTVRGPQDFFYEETRRYQKLDSTTQKEEIRRDGTPIQYYYHGIGKNS